MITMEGSTKIVNIMTPGAEVLELGHGQIVKCIFLLFFLSTLDQINEVRVYGTDDQLRVYKNCKYNEVLGRVFSY